MATLPETVLQFGSGKFLRGFADLFIHQANAEGQRAGRVVVVQSTGAERANLLNRQGGRYGVLVRGLWEGREVDRTEESASVSRALVADRRWDGVLAVARAPELRLILSNTAEAGYALDPADRPGDAPPRSFPGKLLLVLRARWEAGLPGVTLVPCELFEHNADRLRGLLLDLATEWRLPAGLTRWLEAECCWRNTLVDRIVCRPPADHPGLAADPMLVMAEPYALWAVAGPPDADDLFRHPAIRRAVDVQPFFLRKVRILNAAHTAMVNLARPRGVTTVLEAMRDPEIADRLSRLLFEEIVPTVRDRVEDAETFAAQTLERFRNPFLQHQISDIATYHAEKVRIRLVPTRAEYVARFGRTPRLLDEAIGEIV